MNLMHRLLDKPRTVTARRWLFQIHLWVGIFVGLYAIAIGVSGSVLVFREEIVDARTSAHHHVPAPPDATRASPDQWLAAVRQATGHKGPLSMRLPVSSTDAVEVTYYARNSGHAVFVNPYTSQIMARLVTAGPVLRWLDTLHSNFFLGRTGRLLNGIGALLLLALAITGIFIWWPGRRLWRRRLTIDFKGRWKRINWDLHHAIGFWGLAGFTILCITGAWFTWPQFYRQAVARYFPVTAQAVSKVESQPDAPRASLTQLIRAADDAFPGKPVWNIFLPGPPTDMVRINKLGEGNPHRTATTILLNPYSAKVIRVESYANKTTGDKILGWIGPLHTGNFGGLGVKIFYSILGLTMPTLFITGFIMWWQRVVRPRWRTTKPAPEKETVTAVA